MVSWSVRQKVTLPGLVYILYKDFEFSCALLFEEFCWTVHSSRHSCTFLDNTLYNKMDGCLINPSFLICGAHILFNLK